VFDLDDILRAFWQRPLYQRLFLAFTVGLFLSCAARVAKGQTSLIPVAPQSASSIVYGQPTNAPHTR
jgi:hypothetical protein